MLANVAARLDYVFLIFTINDFSHSLHKNAILVFCKQRIPIASPNHFDYVPTGPAKCRFQLLDNFPVAAHGSIEPLQIAVDDKNEIIESLPGSQCDRAQRFRLIRLSVTQKGPYLCIAWLL